MALSRKSVIAAAKQSGYTGDVKDSVAVKSHIQTSIDAGDSFNIAGEILTTDNFDAAWANVQTITVSTVKPVEESVVSKGRNPNASIIGDEDEGRSPQRFIIGDSAKKSYNRLANAGQTALPDADTAEVFGAFARKAIMSGAPHIEYAQKAIDDEICRKSNVTYNFTEGGFVVPESLENTLINIRSQYRALAQVMGTTPIPPAGTSVPRRTSGVTVYSPGEGVAPTESNVAGDQVK
jgi:hypothetical protein